jgi:hypothetical protein
MTTYLIAQFLLIEGLIVFINRLKNEPKVDGIAEDTAS